MARGKYTIRTYLEAPALNAYALLFDPSGSCWNGSEFVAFDGDHETFGIDLIEDSDRTYYYARHIDLSTYSLAPGTYIEEFWQKTGATKDRAVDIYLGIQEHYWVGGIDWPQDQIAIGERAGDIRFVYTLNDTHGRFVPFARVWASADEGGHYPLVAGNTDERGRFICWLNAGSYYFFGIKSGWNITNPDLEVVRAL